MAYVRVRGNQLAVVHGVRDPKTSKVEQQILFTLYSKPEALDAIGRGETPGTERRFEALLSRQYPGITFRWKAIRRQLSEHLHVLPGSYQYKDARLREDFGRDLRAFAKQLLLTDPQNLVSSADVIDAHRHGLEYLRELIGWRLKIRKPEENQWNSDNAFFWRHALPGAQVPVEAEEVAADLFEKRELDRAEAAFRLMVDCFADYADGHNYLGRIAVERGQLEDSIGYFQRAIEAGRGLFPRHIGRKRYWSDHSTRPYMRGLHNMATSLNRLGRYDEALALCERLEAECGDREGAAGHRAAIHLNAGHWAPAVEASERLCLLSQEMSLVAALALREMGMIERALASFLHGALNFPRAARMLLGASASTPRDPDQIIGHNHGVYLLRDLDAYLRRRRKAVSSFFGPVLRAQAVTDLLAEREACARRWFEERANDRRDFDRLQALKSREFAIAKAAELRNLVGLAPVPRSRTLDPRFLN